MIGSTGHMGPRRAMHGFATEQDGRAFDSRIVRRLLPFLRPYRVRMAAAILLMLCSTGLSLLVPYLLKVAIDGNISQHDLSGLLRTALLLVAAYTGAFVAEMGLRYILSWVGQRVLATLREQLFTHLQALHLGYHDRHIVGVTVSRVINDVGVMNDLLSQGIVTVLGDSLLLAGTVVIMLSLSPVLALLSFTVIPAMFLATRVFSSRATSAFRRTRRSVASVVGDLAEDISGIRVIQAFAQESRSRDRFDRFNQDNRDANIRAMTLSFAFLPAVDFLGIVATAIVLLAGGISVAHHAATLGVVVAFLSYVSQFFQPIRELSQIYNTAQAAMAGGEQILDLLDTDPEVTEAADAREIDSVSGNIEFDDVVFSYDADSPVIQHVSFSVPAGTTVALVGPTGAGKTSIANLIARFYDVDSGTVRVDGVDLRTVSSGSYRRHLAIVPQDPFLFSGTIFENVSFGVPNATREQVQEACRRVKADGFIDRLPDGYDTIIQESAANLSVGQRQLLCLARAVICDPKILILDEATANIDSATEALIQGSLEEVFSGRTAVVIAHRLSTIRSSDNILVIASGRIEQQGTHAELLQQGGLYRRLYETQFMDGAMPPSAG